MCGLCEAVEQSHRAQVNVGKSGRGSGRKRWIRWYQKLLGAGRPLAALLPLPERPPTAVVDQPPDANGWSESGSKSRFRP